LRRAADAAKDQSYVLAGLTSRQLSHTLFPIGDSTKAEVRAEAAARGLAVAAKPDSHDICFIPDGDTRAFLSRRLGDAPGPIVDTAGAVLGTHRGTFGYTVGQRHGLGLTRPAADGQPRYVLALRPATGTVVVGAADALATDELRGERVTWAGAAPNRFDGPVFECLVQVRAHGAAVPATVRVERDTVVARLARPQPGVAAGQALVMYDGDVVIGAATITAAVPAGLAR
jgi:tRNA-specific 2-thiouridylase